MSAHITTLPIIVPLIAAALLVATGAFAPRWFNDGIASSVAVAVVALVAVLLHRAATQPIAYWLAGWRPSHGVAIGI